jgi:FkbM family methyltransferase
MGMTYAFGRGSFNFEFLQQNIGQNMTVYDIGANQGQTALFFRQCVGPNGSVYAFEPAPVPFKALVANITLNGWSNVYACQAIVASREGEEHFCYFPNKPTEGKPLPIAAGAPANGAEIFSCPCVSLDKFLRKGNRRPTVIKIDVEGSAGDVLRGARSILRDEAPSIYIEFHNDDEPRAVRDELLSCGYRLETLEGRRILNPVDDWAPSLWCFREK